MHDIEGLIRQIQGLMPGGSMDLRYTVLARLFPPGIDDNNAKRELTELVHDCGCDLRDNPEFENVIITKRRMLFS
jgi:hypothetical protein